MVKMDFNETVFIIQFIAILGLMFYKLYNALSGYVYNYKIIIMTFIGGLLCFGIGLTMTILSYTSLFITQLFKFEIIPSVLIALFTVIEAFMLAQKTTQPRQAYRPLNENGRM